MQHPNEIVSTHQQQISEEKSEPATSPRPARKRKLKAPKSKTPPAETHFPSDFSRFKRDKQDACVASQRLGYDVAGASDGSAAPSVGSYSRSHAFLQNFSSEQDNRDALLGLRYRNQPQLFQSYIKSWWLYLNNNVKSLLKS